MSTTTSSAICHISVSILVLWITTAIVHITFYPSPPSAPPSCPEKIFSFCTLGPTIWATAYIWLCSFAQVFYEYAAYAFFVGSCVGSCFGLLGSVIFVEEDKMGVSAWSLWALWYVTLHVTLITMYCVCHGLYSKDKSGMRERGDEEHHYESLEKGSKRSGEETVFGEDLEKEIIYREDFEATELEKSRQNFVSDTGHHTFEDILYVGEQVQSFVENGDRSECVSGETELDIAQRRRISDMGDEMVRMALES